MKKGDEPAFGGLQFGEVGVSYPSWMRHFVPGLTKREWFAGMALQGWLASMPEEALSEYDRDGMQRAFAQHQKKVAEACFGYADAFIAHEEKEAK